MTAIVVVHRIDPAATEEALASLAASVDVELSVVAVYNGDIAGWPALQALCAAHGATAVRTTGNDGFGAAVNTGLAQVAHGNAVFLLNDDARVSPSAIAECLRVLAMEGPGCISVAPMVVHHEQPERIDSMGVVLRPNGDAFNAYQGRRREEFAAAATTGETIDILGPSFSAALFRAGAFDEAMVGPMATRYFMYFEDVEWNVRARHRGYRSVAAPGAIATHRHALSARTLGEANRFRMVQRNRLLMAVATLSWPGVLRVKVRWLVEHALGVARGPYRRARLAALGGVVRLAPWALARRSSYRGRTPVPDATLFAYATGHQPAISTTDYTLTD
ncbi:MAG: glycosyltransferase family 2 protein [Ilumatobacteraceae bacterium]